MKIKIKLAPKEEDNAASDDNEYSTEKGMKKVNGKVRRQESSKEVVDEHKKNKRALSRAKQKRNREDEEHHSEGETKKVGNHTKSSENVVEDEGDPPLRKRARARATSSSAASHDMSEVEFCEKKVKEIVKKIKNADHHRIFWYPVSEDIAPNYYSIIKDPMDLSKIEKKLNSHKYRSWHDAITDFHQMFSNAFTYNPQGTFHHKETKRVQKIASKLFPVSFDKENAAPAPQKTTTTPPQTTTTPLQASSPSPPSSPVSKVSTSSVQSPKQSKKDKNKERSRLELPPLEYDRLKELMLLVCERMKWSDQYEFFSEPVSQQEVPDYYTIIKNPMDFFTMKKKITEDQYQSWEGFESDYDLVFANCKTYNAYDTIFWKEAARLQRYFRSVLKKGIIKGLQEGKDIKDIGVLQIKEAEKKKAEQIQLQKEKEEQEKQLEKERKEKERLEKKKEQERVEKERQKQLEMERKALQEQEERENRRRKYVKSGMYKRDKEGNFIFSDPKVRREGVKMARKVINPNELSLTLAGPNTTLMVVKSYKRIVEPISHEQYSNIVDAPITQFFSNNLGIDQYVQWIKKSNNEAARAPTNLLQFLNDGTTKPNSENIQKKFSIRDFIAEISENKNLNDEIIADIESAESTTAEEAKLLVSNMKLSGMSPLNTNLNHST